MADDRDLEGYVELNPGEGFGEQVGGSPPLRDALNPQRWKVLTTGEVDAFLKGSAVLYVHSSCVSWLRYNAPEHALIVEFLDGAAYRYEAVDEQEAWQFARAWSKGGKVWDVLRVRGSKTGHKKRFKKLRGPARRWS